MKSRRRFSALYGVFITVAAMGCNALVGNEDIAYEPGKAPDDNGNPPPEQRSPDAERPDVRVPDGGADVDGGADADADTADADDDEGGTTDDAGDD